MESIFRTYVALACFPYIYITIFGSLTINKLDL